MEELVREASIAKAMIAEMEGQVSDFKALLLSEGGSLEEPITAAYVSGMENMVVCAKARAYVLVGLTIK